MYRLSFGRYLFGLVGGGGGHGMRPLGIIISIFMHFFVEK